MLLWFDPPHEKSMTGRLNHLHLNSGGALAEQDAQADRCQDEASWTLTLPPALFYP